MKSIIFLIFSILSLYGRAQLIDGTYISVKDSFREDYFLVIKGDQVTLFGWEIITDNDTIFYRSSSKLDTNNQLTFSKFDYSQEPVTEKNIKYFKPDSKIEDYSFFLHRYLMNLDEVDGQITLRATKDVYDSRLDTFKFKKIK